MSKPELIETIFSSETAFDKKHKINLSNKKADDSVLAKIEAGITLEDLEKIPYPICKYRTQITIHSKFDSLSIFRVGGYKNLFQNKNLSIGIKYNAIDNEKKMRVGRTFRRAGWVEHYDSTGYSLYHYTKYVDTLEEIKKLMISENELRNKIDSVKELYYGTTFSGVYKDAYGRGYFLSTVIHLKAIYEKNLDRFVNTITGLDSKKVEADIEEETKASKAEWDARMERSAYLRNKKIVESNKIVDTVLMDYDKLLMKDCVNKEVVIVKSAINEETEKVSVWFAIAKISKNGRKHSSICEMTRYHENIEEAKKEKPEHKSEVDWTRKINVDWTRKINVYVKKQGK